MPFWILDFGFWIKGAGEEAESLAPSLKFGRGIANTALFQNY
jgi:hypothetical protein